MNKPVKTQEDLTELFEWAKDAGYPYMGDEWTLSEEDGVLYVTDTMYPDGEYPGSTGYGPLSDLEESIFCWLHDC